MTEERVSHTGSRITRTDFKRKGGQTIRVAVWLESSMPQAITYYNFLIYTKGHKCRNFTYEFTSENPRDERYKDFISEQELYKAYYNHWSKLNPFRIFSKGQLNRDFTNFSVVEEDYIFNHQAY